MALTILSFSALIFSWVLFFLLPNKLFVEAGNVELIHRDSPRSPFYNPSDSLFDCVIQPAHRSNSRIYYFRISSKPSSVSPTSVRSEVVPNGGSYLISLSMGTPPLETLAIADTGSDLLWTQCKPCDGCYNQEAPLFDPIQYSTYRNLSCQSNSCQSLPQSSCSVSRSCEYSYSYGDQFFTNGVLASETLTFDSTEINRQNSKDSIRMRPQQCWNLQFQWAALVGLEGGPLSLISQLGSLIEGKFSNCLVPLQENTTSSQLKFGDTAVVSGSNVVSTPLVSKYPNTFYYLTLEEIEFGEKNVKIPESINLKPAQDPSQTFDTCYEAGQYASFPDMTFRFAGADLILKPLNTFIQVSEGVICLALMPMQDFSIFGNIAQQNFKVGYDLVGKKVSFAPTDCSKN
ncbi:aspartic proteinase CDR1-like [Magnolia sinica]|uniref:aspartic proteinase CDR1-like n=1 Tax=Magnolia sinica TaxID=86752 RepID=UPI0026594F95|nr:aspartic proteinase CDR1-like [Magnolia sinica]